MSIRTIASAAALSLLLACGGGGAQQPQEPAAAPPADESAPVAETPSETAAAPEPNPEPKADGRAEQDEPAPAAEESVPAKNTPPATEADLDKAWEFFQALAGAAEQAGGDCDLAAEKLGAVVDDYQGIIDRMKELRDDEEAERLWDQKYGDEADELMKKMMMQDLKDCLQHEGLAKVMRRLG